MKYAFLLLFVCSLSGCFLTASNKHLPFHASPLTVLAVGEAVSYLATDRTLGDHLSSAVTGKHCSIARKMSGEGKYCMTEAEIKKANEPKYAVEKEYCYRSLASVSCYSKPSPYPSDILVGVYERPVYR